MDGLTFVNQYNDFSFFVICVERLTLYISIVWLWYIRSARLISNMDAWKRKKNLKKYITQVKKYKHLNNKSYDKKNKKSIITFYSYHILSCTSSLVKLHKICQPPLFQFILCTCEKCWRRAYCVYCIYSAQCTK